MKKFINTYCKPNPEDEVNLNDSLKILMERYLMSINCLKIYFQIMIFQIRN